MALKGGLSGHDLYLQGLRGPGHDTTGDCASVCKDKTVYLKGSEPHDYCKASGILFGPLSLSPCYETMSLQVGLIGRDRFLIPIKTNARHVRDVKQSVTNFIGLL